MIELATGMNGLVTWMIELVTGMIELLTCFESQPDLT
jgi:hypothetical protein